MKKYHANPDVNWTEKGTNGIIQCGTGGNFNIFHGTGRRALRAAGEKQHFPSSVAMEKIRDFFFSRQKLEYNILVPKVGLLQLLPSVPSPIYGYGINKKCPSVTILNKAALEKEPLQLPLLNIVGIIEESRSSEW